VKAYVFVGPTLAPGDAAAILDAAYLPPVQQGDVYRVAVRHRPEAIGIVDGYFQHVPSVWHKEILWAMAQGIQVFGSASMGALRAAELAPFGMRGVGRIFEAYRSGVFAPYGDEAFEDEDEVAVVHAPPDAGYQPLSEAMVNIRSTLAAAASAGLLATQSRDALVRAAKALFYPDRSWHRVLRDGVERGLSEREIEAVRTWLPAGRIDQKRGDALAMLAAMRDLLAGGPGTAAAVTYVFQASEMWQRVVAEAGPEAEEGAGEIDREAILDELRLEGGYADARRAGVLRWAALRECQRQGLEGTPEARRTVEAAFRDRFGTPRRRDIDRWLVENETDEPGRADLVRDEARLRGLDRALGPRAATQVVAHLRVTGEYSRYAARARAKALALARTGGDGERLDGPTRLRLAVWYFEDRCGGRVPDDLDEYAAAQGFADREALDRALWREYRYLTGRVRPVAGARGVAAGGRVER
jgi:hypothetical protein